MEIFAIIAGVAAGVSGLIYLLKQIAKGLRLLTEIVEDHRVVPGQLASLESHLRDISREVSLNGGASLKDRVRLIQEQQAVHLAYHAGRDQNSPP